MLNQWSSARLTAASLIRSMSILCSVQIAFHPSTEYVSDMAKLNDRREIIVGRDNGTNVTGLFAAGDCTEGVGKEIAVAVGDGARAALSAKSFIRSKAWLEAG